MHCLKALPHPVHRPANRRLQLLLHAVYQDLQSHTADMSMGAQHTRFRQECSSQAAALIGNSSQQHGNELSTITKW